MLQFIRDWKEKAEKESKCRLQAIHIDQGGEFFNTAMKKWCQSLQIKLETTVEDFPEANGIAERCNQTILEKVNAMRFEAGLPRPYCESACVCATYLKNRSPSRDQDITSWEKWYGKRPSAKHYRIFGCPVYVQILKKKRKKLSDKKWKGIFVGYH